MRTTIEAIIETLDNVVCNLDTFTERGLPISESYARGIANELAKLARQLEAELEPLSDDEWERCS